MNMTCIIGGCSRGGVLRKGLCLKHYTRQRRHGDPTRERPSLADRFHAGYTKAPNGCWLWSKAVGATGYGAIQLGVGVTGKAHRVSWELANGQIPEGMSVLHTCDTPACVNPAHLFVGTTLENSQDMVRKGRSLNGDRNPKAKLTAEQVQMVLSSAKPATELATELGVNPETIRRIRRSEAWLGDVERTRAIYRRMTFAEAACIAQPTIEEPAAAALTTDVAESKLDSSVHEPRLTDELDVPDRIIELTKWENKA